MLKVAVNLISTVESLAAEGYVAEHNKEVMIDLIISELQKLKNSTEIERVTVDKILNEYRDSKLV